MADAYYDKVSLLLPMNGSNNSTTFTDYAYPAVQTVTSSGGCKISTAQSAFDGASAYFDGSDDYLSIQHSQYIPQNLTQDWTLEFWFRPSSVAGITFLFHKGAGLQIYMSDTSLYASLSANNSGTYFFSTTLHTGSLTANNWHYAAIVKNGTDYSGYVDIGNSGTATKKSLGTSALNVDAGTGVVYIGCYAGSQYLYTGYVDNMRFTLGQARYSATFSTPTSSFIKTLSGTVKDDTNANAIRTIVAVPRSFPGGRNFTTTSASDGTWSLTVPDTEHTVICLDDAAGTTYNDLIYGGVTPV